jgi:hypothetical protein
MITPEFRLALDCCRWSFQGGENGEVALPFDLNWKKFLRLARFHRIEGLLWNSLSRRDLPDEVRTTFSKAAAGIAGQNLQIAVQSRELLARFEAAGIPVLFLKGLTLGALAYGNPAIKSGIDVDLLVDSRDLGKSADLLRDSGYALIAPRESPHDATLHAWHRTWKESVWVRSSPKVQIDLHTRAADNAHLIPTIEVHASRQLIDVGGGIRLPTLADDELFAYLAVHGASSAWFRLKWISDFAGLIHGRGDLDRIYRRSQQLGAGRAAGQALLLADRLFGVLEPVPELRDELTRDRATRWLYRAALRQLTGDPAEPTERRGGTLAIHATQFLLLPGIGYQISELRRQAGRLRQAP